jgi:hypothetical protein
MKKTIVFSILLISFSGIIFAQGIYIRAGSGYGLPVATSIIGENYNYDYFFDGGPEEESSSNEAVKASYGAGTNFGFAIGYKLNENFILDFNMQYIVGKKFETNYSYSEDYYGSIINDVENCTSYSRGFYFNPGIIFSAGFGKRAPYAKIGIIAASPKVIEDEYYYDDGDGIYEEDITWEYGGGLAIGFQTAVGINWKITDRLDIYSETDFVSMTYYAGEGNMTKYIQNGTDVLDQMSVYNTKILFKKEYDPSTPYDPANPQIMTRESRAFSFISVQVGIRLTVWKQKDRLSDF